MNIAQLKASRALWLRREKYRYARWRWFRYRSKRKAAERLRLREKWWKLYTEAHKERVRRDHQIENAPVKKPSVRQQTVAHAKTYVGLTESPAGSNTHPGTIISKCQIDLLGDDGYAWCGCFQGAMLKWAGVKGVTSRIASVGFIEADARAHRGPFRGWSDRVNPGHTLPGDLLVIGGHGIHVEMVAEVHADGSCTTIGGNTSSGPGGSQSNGGGIWKRDRSASEITGVAHVDFPN